MNDQHALEELEEAWARAERQADAGTLEAISTPDFTLVGPLGFVLEKDQWLDRYRTGDLVTQRLSVEDPVTRLYGDAALTIGRHVQDAEYRGQPANGQFRSTHVAVRTDAGWRLAGIHLSPIGGPPPFARPAGQPSSEGTPRTGGGGR